MLDNHHILIGLRACDEDQSRIVSWRNLGYTALLVNLKRRDARAFPRRRSPLGKPWLVRVSLLPVQMIKRVEHDPGNLRLSTSLKTANEQSTVGRIIEIMVHDVEGKLSGPVYGPAPDRDNDLR